VNRINFYLEIGLTLSIFLSSFLILSIEKDWWGGYLSAEKNVKVAHNFNEWMNYGKRMSKPNPRYIFENTIRLIVIGSSITFFLLMSIVECTQVFVTAMCVAYDRIQHTFYRILSRTPLIGFSLNMYKNQNSPRTTNELKSHKQIIYETTIILSNLQMLVLMLSIIAFAIGLGYI
jgi:hypothetical protein